MGMRETLICIKLMLIYVVAHSVTAHDQFIQIHRFCRMTLSQILDTGMYWGYNHYKGYAGYYER